MANRRDVEQVIVDAVAARLRPMGSAFSYRARYSKQAVTLDEGDRRRFRRISSTGLWMDQVFCPNCGTIIYMEAEVIEDKIVVSVGCFGEPDFRAPASIFWSRRRHDWYQPDEEINLID
ncbi:MULTISPECIES: GFA family protein [unclassified Ensifer]|uniref:GFA family protein n=1 Tax=unclassified Ensifer TaxID=2633371 RepID=UPI00081303ED|nr:MULTISPECIES: GFA family protein [unclassified Ensifer]OCP03070.1 hypothetical protein BC362_18190 [Ensifer sp. LC14]OCP08139.1 hypothetical protein BBX50_20325 [Ensifer sp. LC11]OCP08810.1 hypothetical protein BC374_20515 [Ensifer sp. LC13]OCP32179.1 hypothetical protein BC364_19800 [Ensifer sp. LC499]